MSAHCCPVADAASDRRYRRVLLAALAVNTTMFALEISASAWSGSSALAADAADFLADAGNYAISLGAIALGGAWRARAALAKGVALAVFGAAVLGYAGWRMWAGAAPEPITMGAVAIVAFAANLAVALLLFRFRNGDADMRSVWLCTRNDVIGNLAVLGAAGGVFGTGSVWPDIAVAGMMAGLAIAAAIQIIAGARTELFAP